jgi:hypothetical protein
VRLTAGTRLGPYEIVELLGAGGMGEVYRARDSRIGREVAVKMISGALGADGPSLERFERFERCRGCQPEPYLALGARGGIDPKPGGRPGRLVDPKHDARRGEPIVRDAALRPGDERDLVRVPVVAGREAAQPRGGDADAWNSTILRVHHLQTDPARGREALGRGLAMARAKRAGSPLVPRQQERGEQQPMHLSKPPRGLPPVDSLPAP